MNPDLTGAAAPHPGQHRLRRIQLANWGTFDGLFTIEVPRSGLLVTGPSGSGKSSLLDALATVLVQPKWLTFNAAAQEGSNDRSRSLVSYVRGAHRRETDADSGEVTTAYLRPGATWSGIALTYDDAHGTVTTLLRLFHLARGSTAVSDLRYLNAVVPGPLDLLSLEPYVANGVELRRLRTARPDWTVTDTYDAFAGSFRRRLGLASEQSQRLLHKTQSAKNLSSLDQLLREFMLDEPGTFKLAEQAVEQFAELEAAHAAVVDARRQVEVLAPLRTAYEEHGQVAARLDGLRGQAEHLTAYVRLARIEQADRALAGRRLNLERLQEEAVSAQTALDARQSDRDLARARVDGAGGGQLDRLQEAVRHAGEAAAMVSRGRDRWEETARVAGTDLPQQQAALADWAAGVEAALGELAESGDDSTARNAIYAESHDARRRVADLERRLEALNRERSNLDPVLLDLRRRLADALGVTSQQLPFAGELISVLPGEQRWTGAIERVLRPFAHTLVVPDELYPGVGDHVDRHHLGARLVYERVLPGEPATSSGAGRDPLTLAGKVAVAEGPLRAWVEHRLARRYDHVCVERPSDLARHQRAVTLAGQVKHSRSRHEKDDRHRVDDPTRWVLGSSAEARRRALEDALALARSEAVATAAAADAASAAHDRRRGRAEALTRLRTLTWAEVDTAGARRMLDEAQRRLADFRAQQAGLDEALRGLEAAEAALETSRGVVTGLAEGTGAARAEVERHEASVARLRSLAAQAPPVPEAVAAALAPRVTADDPDLDGAENKVAAELRHQTERANARSTKLANRMVQRIGDYRRDWPLRAADLSSGVEDCRDYLAILDGLEADGLPAFEDRFFSLLQNQSRNNIGTLSNQIRTEKLQVRSRLNPINESLALTEYAPGLHLRLKREDRHLPEATQFVGDLRQVTSWSLTDAPGEDEAAGRRQNEERFLGMQRLIKRLGSAEPVDRAWRQRCLDTRLHVQFTAQVLDQEDRQVDVYAGSGGLSGGERQKLVTFCLAAALRYQLARDGARVPDYALVVLDEAFDKTDPAFTRAGLEVFRAFDFQMLLATPLKMLQTLEEYVGGTVVVQNEPGAGSRLEALLFDAPAEVVEHVPDSQEFLV